MEAPTTSQPAAAPPQPLDKVAAASGSRTPGLSALPQKQPARRAFGFLRGRRK